MKTTQTTQATRTQLYNEVKQLTRSSVERSMMEQILTSGYVRPVRSNGRSYDDRTTAIVTICNQLGLQIIQGNDALRGGKIGNFIELSKEDSFLEQEKQEEQIIARKSFEINEKKRKEQKKLLIEFINNDNKFKTKIENLINNKSSKIWRNSIKLIVCKKLTSGKFSEMKLTTKDIMECFHNK